MTNYENYVQGIKEEIEKGNIIVVEGAEEMGVAGGYAHFDVTGKHPELGVLLYTNTRRLDPISDYIAGTFAELEKVNALLLGPGFGCEVEDLNRRHPNFEIDTAGRCPINPYYVMKVTTDWIFKVVESEGLKRKVYFGTNISLKKLLDCDNLRNRVFDVLDQSMVRKQYIGDFPEDFPGGDFEYHLMRDSFGPLDYSFKIDEKSGLKRPRKAFGKALEMLSEDGVLISRGHGRSYNNGLMAILKGMRKKLLIIKGRVGGRKFQNAVSNFHIIGKRENRFCNETVEKFKVVKNGRLEVVEMGEDLDTLIAIA